MRIRTKVDIVEMVSKNVVEYMKYQKQPLRAAAVDTREQFTKVIKIDDVYGDVLEGEAETDLSLVQAIEVGMPEVIGEEIFRKRKATLYRIEGYAFSSRDRLKEHKKRVKENAKYDHRNFPFVGELIALWRSVYQKIVDVLTEEGFVEVWRNSDLKKRQFCEVDKELDDVGRFGLKANGRFRGIKFSLSKDPETLKSKILKRLNLKSDVDIYGIKWPLIELDEIGKIWIDTIVALMIEEKCVSKKGCFSKVVT